MRIFGFDLGIASIGWAVIEIDRENPDVEAGFAADGKIIAMGSRIFPVAEHPKDGSSLAEPRRSARLLRRVIRRRALRMIEMKKMLESVLNLSSGIDSVIAKQEGGDIWTLRAADSFQRKLSDAELARVLIHLTKHRGFKSSRKSAEEKDSESGKILNAIKENLSGLSEYKTLAQSIYARPGRMRNGEKIVVFDKDGNVKKDKAGKIITESSYKNSIPRAEIEREAKLILEYQNRPELFEKWSKIALRQRPIAGVGKMVGMCTFEKSEKCAPKESPTAELFVALTKINNTNIIVNGEKRLFSSEERAKILQLLKDTKEVKYSNVEKKIFPKQNVIFPDINFEVKDKKTGIIKWEDKKFFAMTGWHKLKSVLSDSEMSDIKMLDKIINSVATEKSDIAIIAELKKQEIPDNIIKKVKDLSSAKFISLSLKALYKIVPEMGGGLHYDKACEQAGYDPRDTGESLVSARAKLLGAIASDKLTKVPVVNRTIAQFRKVYNAMVRDFGAPDQVNLEIGRELKKSHKERNDIEKNQEENRKKNDIAKKQALDNGIKDYFKYRLYNEQDGKSVYSGKALVLEELENYEIDHILPYSRSLDNSQNNRVLVLQSENQAKGNKTPYEWLSANGTWDDFKVRVENSNLPYHKKLKLLNTGFSETENEEKFRERNANDNAYIAKYISQYLRDGADFSESKYDIKNRIQVRTGSLTAFMRNQWGLDKNRQESDKHHAQDAVVIACATQGMVQYLSDWSAKKGTYNAMNKDNWDVVKKRFSQPWKGFRDQVKTNLDNIFVSRPPRKKASGSAHADTVISVKKGGGSLPIRGGMTNKENMFRLDIFRKNEKFFVVPIFVSDLVNTNRKNIFYPQPAKASAPVEIDDSYEFLMTLHKDDYIKIKTKSGEEFEGYIIKAAMPAGQFVIRNHDNSYVFSKTTSTFEPGEIIVVDGDICKVIEFRDNKLIAMMLNGIIHELDAAAKTSKTDKVPKAVKLSQEYIKFDNQKEINIGTFTNLQKIQVDILGNKTPVGPEKRELVLRIKKRDKAYWDAKRERKASQNK